MAGQTRVTDQGALHSELQPAPRSDRAAMGADASPRDPQPKPPELQRLLPIRSAFPARGGAEKLGRLLRFGHRQFPRHQPCRFSGSQGVGVYDLSWLNPTPHAIAVYASQPLSPVAPQHSLPSGRYSLLGPDFHRLDRTSFTWRTHSITSSAVASSVGGTSRPSALAAFRLITSSNLVGSCTGRSAGFSPLRMRST